MSFLVLGYFGPETTLPVASALAAAIGALLIGWNYLLLACKKTLSLVRRSSAASVAEFSNGPLAPGSPQPISVPSADEIAI